MTRRKRCSRALAVVALVALPAGLWFEPTGIVRGWWHGEPFYRGRPASYWREVFVAERPWVMVFT